MNIEEIPSDELLPMSELWHRAFNAAGCNPMCHCCGAMLPVGSEFKLATVEELPYKHIAQWMTNFKVPDEDKEITSREVMLCKECTPEKYLQLQKDLLSSKNVALAKEALKAYFDSGGGCYRINGKIVV